MNKDAIPINKLSWQTSLILDILRLSAALIVFFFHGYRMWFTDNFAEHLDLAHFSVVIFFVLSGYLIAYTTTNNNRGAIQYAQARLSRLYSILLPAILITAISQAIVFYADPLLYRQYANPPVILRYLISALFLNDIWFLSASPKINGPLWSLSYEFWYYVIFGLWFYSKKTLRSRLLLLAAVLVAGPSILAMMPVWLMGCLAYRYPLWKLTFKTSIIVVTISIFAAVVLLKYMPALPFPLGKFPLHYANQFIKDIVLAFFVFIALSAITQISTTKKKPGAINTFRKIADLTFPLYLLHFPLLILWQSIFTKKEGDVEQFIIALCSVMAIIIPTGLFLERKRNWWNMLCLYPMKQLKAIQHLF